MHKMNIIMFPGKHQANNLCWLLYYRARPKILQEINKNWQILNSTSPLFIIFHIHKIDHSYFSQHYWVSCFDNSKKRPNNTTALVTKLQYSNYNQEQIPDFHQDNDEIMNTGYMIVRGRSYSDRIKWQVVHGY